MRPFDDATRRNIAAACAAFTRLPEDDAPAALKHAAVAVALTAASDGDDTEYEAHAPPTPVIARAAKQSSIFPRTHLWIASLRSQ